MLLWQKEDLVPVVDGRNRGEFDPDGYKNGADEIGNQGRVSYFRLVWGASAVFVRVFCFLETAFSVRYFLKLVFRLNFSPIGLGVERK